MENDLQEKVKGPVVVFAKGIKFEGKESGNIKLSGKYFGCELIEEVYDRTGVLLWKNDDSTRQTHILGRSLGKGAIVGFNNNMSYLGETNGIYYFAWEPGEAITQGGMLIEGKHIADIQDRNKKSLI